MTLEITNEYGSIDISNDVIATLAGGAAVECYGIVGMASKHQVRDGIAEITNEYGSIDISNDVIATLAGGAAVECYGIVGMASKHQVRDGIAEILGRDNYAKGVIVSQNEGVLDVDMYIIVSYGTKISEIANNVQSAVKYTLEQSLNLKVNAVNIYIQGVRVINDDEEA